MGIAIRQTDERSLRLCGLGFYGGQQIYQEIALSGKNLRSARFTMSR